MNSNKKAKNKVINKVKVIIMMMNKTKKVIIHVKKD